MLFLTDILIMNSKNLKDKDVKVGLRIKFTMPTKWCQVVDSSPFIWFKGRIIEHHNEMIIVCGKNRKHKMYLDRIMCFSKNGEYHRIKKQK